MYPAFFGLLAVAVISIALFALLFTGGRLIRRALIQSEAKAFGARTIRSRFFRDLDPLEDLLVDFIAQTPEFAEVLRLLARHDKPLPFAQIVHELRIVRNGSTRIDAFASLSGIALIILNLAGLAKLERNGFVATTIGREVRLRMLLGSTQPARVSIGETRAQVAANLPSLGLSVGKRPADNPGIGWRSSLREVTPPQYSTNNQQRRTATAPFGTSWGARLSSTGDRSFNRKQMK